MNRTRRLWRYPITRLITMAAVLVMLLGFAGYTSRTTTHAAGNNACQLDSAQGNIKHVIYVQFDNVHFTRDNPHVPSDLEQMPNLLNFMTNNGVLLSDRHGVPISNSFRYFNPDGTSNTGVSFAYWTAPIFDPTTATPTDTKFNMLTASGQNAPAPWVPYTRAGCNVGSVATANTILENISIDIPTVFGANSPEAQEAATNPKQATADFVGIGIHCAQNNAICSSSNTGDLLPDEPGGYTGFNGLFGHKYVAPIISPNGPLKDLNGNVIQDTSGHIGFPGFDGMSAAVSLSYVAAMQEHGVPVTYAYISDAHDKHPIGPAYGPGQAGYVQALQSYDKAFGSFFKRLQSDGINKSNSLFVFTADEGDHFVGGAPSPVGCDGVTTPCTYSQIGEINANMAGLLATEQGVTTPFKVHSDSAPNVYITGNPARDAPVTRAFDRGVGKLTAVNPMTGNTDTLTKSLADPVEMKILHMVTADPARTPTRTMFADPNYFLFAGAPNCTSPCVTQQPGFAWNHGDVSPDINTTWLGIVGPGIRAQGVNSSVWSDHTDIRPTMMELLGLKDDYSHDGRVLFEVMKDSALPEVIRQNRDAFTQLAQVYKQIDACVGQLGLATLAVSTKALESGSSSDDNTYTKLENQLISINDQRDALAAQIIALLEGSEFNGQPFSDQQAQQLIAQGQALLKSV